MFWLMILNNLLQIAMGLSINIHFSIFYHFLFFHFWERPMKWKSRGTLVVGAWERYSTVCGVPSSISFCCRNLASFGSMFSWRRVEAYGSLALEVSVLPLRKSSDSWASIMASLPSSPWVPAVEAEAAAVPTNPGIGTGWDQYPAFSSESV